MIKVKLPECGKNIWIIKEGKPLQVIVSGVSYVETLESKVIEIKANGIVYMLEDIFEDKEKVLRQIMQNDADTLYEVNFEFDYEGLGGCEYNEKISMFKYRLEDEMVIEKFNEDGDGNIYLKLRTLDNAEETIKQYMNDCFEITSISVKKV